MRKIAIIPWGYEYMNDTMFNSLSPYNRDGSFMTWIEMKAGFEKNGWEVHTIDVYPSIEEIELFIFYSFNKEWYVKIRQHKLENRTIYVAFEPPVVDKNHSKKGINNLLHYFRYILTWDDDIVDNKRIFKFMYPYWFDIKKNNKNYFEKKLLVNISGNKKSKHKSELYSLRKEVINYFDKSPEFSLYGPGWEKENLLSYKGLAKSKSDVYSNYKFALCLENMCDVKGYITEKILDCFCYGIIPIYKGASNIKEFIPPDCFIEFDKFDNLEELENYITSMKIDEYSKYLNSASDFLNSNKMKVFKTSEFVNILISLIKTNDEPDVMLNGSILYMKIKVNIIDFIRKLKRSIKKNQTTIGENSFIDKNSVVGEFTYIGRNCSITKATIGRYCSIGNNVSIGPGEHNINRISTSSHIYEKELNWYDDLTSKSVTIGNDVWVGTDSIIKRGINIGNGAVIGANSFVNKDVPSFAVVAGSPARIIKYRFEKDKKEIIEKSEWWKYDIKEARKIIQNLEKTNHD